jgi:hypothetical protein
MSVRAEVGAARRWSSLRIPNALFTWGPPLTVLVYVILTWSEPVRYAETITEVLSWQTALDETIFGVLVVCCVLGWLVPRVAAVVLTVSISPLADPALDPVARHLWLVWVAVILLDVSARAWQRSVSTPLGDASTCELSGAITHRRADVFRFERRAATALLVLAVAATAWFWVDRRQELAALDLRAQPSTGTVRSVDTADDVLSVRVDGSAHDFWVSDAMAFEAGQTVPVLVDPTGVERPFGLGNADPDGWTDLLVLLGGLLCALVLVVGYGPLQARRLASVVRAGERGRRGWFVPADDGMLVWLPGSEPEHDPPSALLPAPRPLALGPDPADLGGDEEVDEDDELDVLVEPREGTVHGMLADGGPTAVVLVDGSAWLSLRAARDPWTTTALWARLVDRVETVLPWRAARARSAPPEATSPRERPRLSPVRHLLPWWPAGAAVALVLLHVVVRWLSSGPDGVPLGWIPMALASVTAGGALGAALSAARFPLAHRSGHLVVRGSPFDLVVGVDHLESVTRGTDEVVIELDGDLGTIHVHDPAEWGRLDDVAAVAETPAASTGPGRRVGVRRQPSLLLLSGPATFLSMASAVWLATDGAVPWW